MHLDLEDQKYMENYFIQFHFIIHTQLQAPACEKGEIKQNIMLFQKSKPLINKHKGSKSFCSLYPERAPTEQAELFRPVSDLPAPAQARRLQLPFQANRHPN
jgi:hypothetical protein